MLEESKEEVKFVLSDMIRFSLLVRDTFLPHIKSLPEIPLQMLISKDCDFITNWALILIWDWRETFIDFKDNKGMIKTRILESEGDMENKFY